MNFELEKRVVLTVELIRNKVNESRKAHDKEMESVYSMLLSKALIAEKSGKYPDGLSEDVLVGLAKKEVKEMQETLSFYKEENDRTRELNAKIKELSQYIPAELTEEQVIEVIKKVAQSETNRGKVIGIVCKEVGNNFDRSKVAPLVNKVMLM